VTLLSDVDTQGALVTADTTLRLINAGPLTTIQDLGRTGYAHYGVTTSGALDQESFAMANRLVGNSADRPALELTLGGLTGTLNHGRWASVTGAPAPVTIAGRSVPDPYLFWIPADAVFKIGTPAVGLRSYLAICGGIVVEPVLGSCSTDTLSGIGPSVVQDGSHLRIGPAETPTWDTDSVFSRVPIGIARIRFRWGPRDELFTAEDKKTLVGSPWTVSSETNRVGTRLTGQRILTQLGSLPSEGTALGSIQIPPSGEPIVFMADRPVTGGYPVIGVVTEADLGIIAQARPGSKLALIPA